jgi:hypothetical protein
MTTKSDDYFAGLFDGEGCVSMHLARAGYVSVQVRVTMCDRAPIYALYQRFGGHFDEGKTQTKTGRSIYVWYVFNAQCVEALQVFSKLCLVKQVVAQAALPTALSMAANPTRGVLAQEEKAARVEAARLIAKVNKPVGNRQILDKNAVEAYMAPKRMGGGKKVKLSDGRLFGTLSDAAKALGVSISAVSLAKRKGSKTAGVTVEAA